MYDTCSYSEKSIKESRGSRQLDCELEVAMLDEDCVEEVIVMWADEESERVATIDSLDV